MNKIIYFIIVLIAISQSGIAEGKIQGIWEVVAGADIANIKKTGKVELKEFFNFSCGHCYKFLETAKRLEKKYKNKLIHKSMPIYWQNQTPYPAMVYLIAIDNGIESAAKKEIFNARFKMGIDTFDYRMINFIASSLGIGEKFDKGSQTKELKDRITKIQMEANRFGAKQTPTIILNDIIMVNPSMTGGNIEKMTDNLDIIIGDILN